MSGSSAESTSQPLGAGAGQRDGDESRTEEPVSPSTRQIQPPVNYWLVWDKTFPPSLVHTVSDLALAFSDKPLYSCKFAPDSPSSPFAHTKGNPRFGTSHPDQLFAESSWSKKLTLPSGPSPSFHRGWWDPSVSGVGSRPPGSPARSHLIGAEGAVLVYSDALGAALGPRQHAAVIYQERSGHQEWRKHSQPWEGMRNADPTPGGVGGGFAWVVSSSWLRNSSGVEREGSQIPWREKIGGKAHNRSYLRGSVLLEPRRAAHSPHGAAPRGYHRWTYHGCTHFCSFGRGRWHRAGTGGEARHTAVEAHPSSSS